jgi:hypothetical protein
MNHVIHHVIVNASYDGTVHDEMEHVMVLVIAPVMDHVMDKRPCNGSSYGGIYRVLYAHYMASHAVHCITCITCPLYACNMHAMNWSCT